MVKIKKQKNKAWVTFNISVDANEVFIKGSWNGWKQEAMKRKKDGSFYIRKSLPLNNRYEFGYLADGRWITDDTLETVETPFNSNNSILKL